MQASPTRLKAKRQPLLRRGPGKGEDTAWDSFVPTRGHVLRRLRVIRRGLTVLLWTLPCMLVQSILLLLPGHAKVAFARLYWAGMCRAIGLDIRVIGAPAAKTPDGRPVIYVSNHSSWLDILVLGGRLEACFIAKDEIGAWPLIRQIARLGRTVYVRRARASIGRERDEMGRRLSQGDNLVLFPEGTTSDGSRVLPFRSAFLSVAELAVSVVYDRLAGLPAGRACRPIFAWYGDMDIATHFWRLGQHRGLRATVLLHTPLDPARFPSRKALAAATWTAVAEGAATLRQNRPARPLTAGGETAAPDPSPAFA